MLRHYNRDITEVVSTPELDGSCVSDEDCSEIQHAKCSEQKKCVCRPNNIRINDTHCAPPLGAFCWKDEKCATNNAVCIDNECQCSKQHIQNNNQCILIYLGIQCEGDSFCQRFINHSKCSESGKCVCDSNDYIIDNNACVPKFNAYCFTDEPCATHNAMCIDNKCQCKPNHIFRGSQCFPIHLFEECNTHRDCHEIEFAKCSDLHQCICRDKYLPINKSTCAPSLGAACSRNAPCIPTNLKCTQNKCQYPAKPIILSNKEPTKLGTYCENEEDCSDVLHAICPAEKRCVCREHNRELNHTYCAPSLGAFCWKEEKCATDNATCIDSQCQCNENYHQSNDQCLRREYAFNAI
ncbi:prion-like-(Q/N-rich) domain-bearing protein 25 [Microplitis mediator]|uniref:prion-like-(Q/N-rich) domain-bearing protein 25 n=1 Tax=Microplitis mediator TaxID=375433 RepID=UPI0025539F83|nr:prion-like-(Q/N-rich) domain-bearing protein 25 [Microplitis mediator]